MSRHGAEIRGLRRLARDRDREPSIRRNQSNISHMPQLFHLPERAYTCVSSPYSASVARSNLTHSYLIPGKNGSLKPGERLLNYVWYCNYAANSPEFHNLMTDTEGHHHRITMPMGKMRPEVYARQKAYADKILPAAFAEVVRLTQQPFVQCITDASAPRAVFFDVSSLAFIPAHLDNGYWRLEWLTQQSTPLTYLRATSSWPATLCAPSAPTSARAPTKPPCMLSFCAAPSHTTTFHQTPKTTKLYSAPAAKPTHSPSKPTSPKSCGTPR